MSAGIQHLVNGNKNREARVDKIETDQFNSIVERITHGRLNPSKLAAEVTKAKVLEESPDPASIPRAAQLPGQIATWGAGPAHQLAGQRPDAHVNFLAEKVAMLERKLAQYEGDQDNDVVSTTNTPADDRGADSSAMGSNVIRKKNAKTKDPVDGKPDGDKPSGKSAQKQPEAQMAGVHVNILGMSMTEWREMTGIKSPPVDLTARSSVNESYEDEDEVVEGGGSRSRKADRQEKHYKAIVVRPEYAADKKLVRGSMAHNMGYDRNAKGVKGNKGSVSPSREEPYQARADLKKNPKQMPELGIKHPAQWTNMKNAEFWKNEHQLWANFLENYDMTPEEFSAFVEAADEVGDEEALVAVMEIEEEFQEALANYMGEAASTPSGRAALRDIGVSGQDEPKPPPVRPADRAKVGLKPLLAKGGSTERVRGALGDVKKLSSMGRLGDSIEYQLWTSFLEGYESTPEEFSVFVEEADETGDEEALVTVMELEDEFQEALAYCSEGNDAERQAKLDDYVKQHGVKKLPTRKARTLPRMRVRGGPATQFGHQLPKKMDDDIDQLWSQWLGERDLSVEVFDALVESAKTDEDLTALEELQDMFLAEMKVGDTVAVDSVLDKDTLAKTKPADNSANTVHPLIKKMAALRKMGQPKPVEDDDAFECDDDGNGHPDMNGKDWTDAMKKLKKKHGRSRR
jgi:hypothetical protein